LKLSNYKRSITLWSQCFAFTMVLIKELYILASGHISQTFMP